MSQSTMLIIRLILLVVLLGSFMIWIMLPTKTYKNVWTLNLQSKLNSTYFGEQGVNLLLFSFPMMFIAALSYVYLHFQKKSNRSTSTSTLIDTSRLTFWSRPTVVKAPMGIVTAMELAFAVMFVALLVWSLANYLYVSFGSLHMHMAGEKVWEAKFRSVSLRLGYIGHICWAFLFVPVTRGSSILPLFGLTSESSIKYHIWLGHISMVLFLAHTVGFLIYWGITDQMVLMLEWSKTYLSNVAGGIAIVLAMAIWVTSIPRFRRKMFEVFFYTHHLYPLYIFFYILHVGPSYFCMILPGIFLFIIDRYLRFLQSYQRAGLVSARLLPCATMELNFAKTQGLDYNPTSILFINVPSISKLQWHPFTVTSNSNMEPNKLSIVIKSEGSWSQKLYKQLSSNVDHHIQVSVEGPYGPTSSHFLRHEALVMFSGGSGITPMISILREIIFQSTKTDFPVPRVRLICAFKDSADLSMLQLLLPSSCNPAQYPNVDLQIEAYVTREKEQPPAEALKPIETVSFKPDLLDSPISADLVPNSLLWLAAIVSSSFVLFLLTLGLTTRFYIYPIVKTGEVYHYSYTCLWYMFLVCACIFVVSSAVFLWCKRQNAIEGKQVQNVEVPTPPTSSPGYLMSYGTHDRELESLPHHHESPIAQATQVLYGTRPDLKKILLETKGSDVGVVVSGPRTMRHEVANICSSGLAGNLHFESASFNW